MHPIRRQLLRAGVAAGTLPFVLAGCSAARQGIADAKTTAAAGSRIADGVYRRRMGNTTITAISDGTAERPLADGFVRNASLEQVRKALADGGLPTDKLTLTFTAILLETGGRRVLLDSGNGQFGAASSGRLTEGLRAAGSPPETIDAVLISHFHGDHINGLRGKDGVLVYPKAEIVVPAPEWDFWMNDARMAAAPDALKGSFQTARRVFSPIASQVRRFKPGDEVLPGIHSMAAFGHTPGHTLFSTDTGAGIWTFLADTANIPALFVRNPDWAIMFDMDAEAARRARRAVFDRAIHENWLVSGYHFPFPAIGHITRRGTGYDFSPAS